MGKKSCLGNFKDLSTLETYMYKKLSSTRDQKKLPRPNSNFAVLNYRSTQEAHYSITYYRVLGSIPSLFYVEGATSTGIYNIRDKKNIPAQPETKKSCPDLTQLSQYSIIALLNYRITQLPHCSITA